MKQIRRIVVGIGDDKATAGALEAALRFAADEGAEVVLAQVVPIPGEQFIRGHTTPSRAVGDPRTPELLTAEAGARNAGIPATRELLMGYPPRELALLAEDVGASLVVVGSHVPSDLKPAYLGSTSRHLLLEAPCPGLDVPEPAAAEEPAAT
jgi:nucleotide-binding universal stress UspA family protein